METKNLTPSFTQIVQHSKLRVLKPLIKLQRLKKKKKPTKAFSNYSAQYQTLAYKCSYKDYQLM